MGAAEGDSTDKIPEISSPIPPFVVSVVPSSGSPRDLNSNSKPKGFLGAFFTSRLCLYFVLIYFLVATGVAATFLRGFLQLTQIQSEKATLIEENNKFEELLRESDKINDELRDEIEKLRDENVEYAELNERFEKSNSVLNATTEDLIGAVANLTEQVDKLKDLNAVFGGLNHQLNETVLDLRDGLENLDSALVSLNSTAEILKETNGFLLGQVAVFNDTTFTLGEEINRLSKIENMIRESTTNNQNNVTDLLEILDKSIDENQAILNEIKRQNLRGEYSEAVKTGIEKATLHFDVMSNFTRSSSIGDRYTDALAAIYRDLLNDICGNMADFDSYIKTEREGGMNGGIANEWMSYDDMLRYAYFYVDMLQNYYFSDNETGEGITREQWFDADYQCAKLDPHVIFYEA